MPLLHLWEAKKGRPTLYHQMFLVIWGLPPLKDVSLLRCLFLLHFSNFSLCGCFVDLRRTQACTTLKKRVKSRRSQSHHCRTRASWKISGLWVILHLRPENTFILILEFVKKNAEVKLYFLFLLFKFRGLTVTIYIACLYHDKKFFKTI